eukprot:SAG11_NODE_8668_length_989_cov_0.921348_1_plen_308_part_10
MCAHASLGPLVCRSAIYARHGSYFIASVSVTSCSDTSDVLCFSAPVSDGPLPCLRGFFACTTRFVPALSLLCVHVVPDRCVVSSYLPCGVCLCAALQHGFLMGEHDWWAKNTSPWFQEVAHIPMWVWDPRVPEAAGSRRETLVQTIDVGVSLLDFFELPLKDSMIGTPLRFAMEDANRELHEIGGGLFGIFGAQVTAVDSSGQYIYMRGPAKANNAPLSQYTLMPTRMRGFMDQTEMSNWELHDGFDFTKGQRLMKVPGADESSPDRDMVYGTLLYDVFADPKQDHPLGPESIEIEKSMIRLLLTLMQ